MSRSASSGSAATAFAPATVANVCVGFDVLGFALAEVGDRATVTRTEEDGVVRVLEGELDGNLSFVLDPIFQEIVTCTIWNSYNYEPAINLEKVNDPTELRGDLTPPAEVTSTIRVILGFVSAIKSRTVSITVAGRVAAVMVSKGKRARTLTLGVKTVKRPSGAVGAGSSTVKNRWNTRPTARERRPRPARRQPSA